MIDERLVEFVARLEGFRASPYRCPAGVVTVGYGRTEGVDLAVVTTEDAERAWLEERLEFDRYTLQYSVPKGMNPWVYDACTSFAYNVGTTAFKKSSVCKALQAGNIIRAGQRLMLWCQAGGKRLPGLERRRKLERALMLGGYDDAAVREFLK